MASRGQRFTLDPEADNFTFNIHENEGVDVDTEHADDALDLVKEIREKELTGVPPPPKPKQTKTGFPQHRLRNNASAFKPQQRQNATSNARPKNELNSEPSDRAILAQVSRRYGVAPEVREKAEISEENARRIAQMSTKDIEQARAEIMSSLSPAYLERLLKRANIEEDRKDHDWEEDDGQVRKAETQLNKQSSDITAMESLSPKLPDEEDVSNHDHSPKSKPSDIEAQFQEVAPSIHFPVPPRNPDDYVPLNPNSPSFLTDLKKHYFPDLPSDPSTLAWLRDPTEEESNASSYAPTQTRYAPSDIRFDFTGRLLAPNESREIPTNLGLHHHGEAPESAGYTIPELSILARSSLPNQRCIAYQVLGRMLYRLGRGDFGPRGSELQEGLWACVEKERPVEVMMSEANRTGGHVSAKAYATEALWLWRKGGGGERGILKPGETLAK